jgi:hypothetical protein
MREKVRLVEERSDIMAQLKKVNDPFGEINVYPAGAGQWIAFRAG